MNHQAMSRRALFDTISAVSFAMDELRLFLDTHPGDSGALNLFTEYMNRRHELVGQYTREYGPLDSYYLNTEYGWSWTDEPMPWKAEAN